LSVAKGRGSVGDKIIEVAKANNIPIEENEVLAGALSNVELGDEIPAELYKAGRRSADFRAAAVGPDSLTRLVSNCGFILRDAAHAPLLRMRDACPGCCAARSGALLIRGPLSPGVPALRCTVKNAAPRPGHRRHCFTLSLDEICPNPRGEEEVLFDPHGEERVFARLEP